MMGGLWPKAGTKVTQAFLFYLGNSPLLRLATLIFRV